jgi:hypothetical protein
MPVDFHWLNLIRILDIRFKKPLNLFTMDIILHKLAAENQSSPCVIKL